MENNYYNEIKELIETKEINSRVRAMQDNSDTLNTYWNIGRLIVEAQGGEKRAKYGNELIKKWSEEFTQKYGKGYDFTNLSRFRKFYLCFSIVGTVCQQLSWSHYRYILSISNQHARNYYVNLSITNNLSVRELREEIKNKSYERLAYADKENIKLIDANNYSLTIEDMIKDPIIIEASTLDNLNEKTLHKYIIEMLENRFLELGVGFALVGHEYKIKEGKHIYSLDLLFFNTELNCYVVVELKLKTISKKDIDQTYNYVTLVDKYVKKTFHSKTIGVIIAKSKDGWIIAYATSKDIYTTTYKLREELNL